jgi:hypothetical protein
MRVGPRRKVMAEGDRREDTIIARHLHPSWKLSTSTTMA